jgi:hypothetical protein
LRTKKIHFQLSPGFRPLNDSKLTLAAQAKADGAGERSAITAGGDKCSSKAFAGLSRCPPHGSFVPILLKKSVLSAFRVGWFLLSGLVAGVFDPHHRVVRRLWVVGDRIYGHAGTSPRWSGGFQTSLVSSLRF